MTYALLIKKLYLNDATFIESDLLRDYCKKLNMDYNSVIGYLTSHRYLIRILRGLFYKPSIEERKLNTLRLDYMDAIKTAMEFKDVKNWYFGLESALKLNNLTHEFFTVDCVVNDKIFRANNVRILGHETRFIKLKKGLFDFGISWNKFPVSDTEKTLLDIIYLSKYEGLRDEEIKAKIVGLLKSCSKKNILRYAIKYNKSVYKFVEKII